VPPPWQSIARRPYVCIVRKPKERERITVLLADDNRIVRECFREILERADDLEVVGEAKNGLEALALVKKLRPALVLMDVAMPLLNGLKATSLIVHAFPVTKVLMLSAHEEEAYITQAIQSGAMGYLIKQASTENLCQAIREIQQGRMFFSPSIPRRLCKPPRLVHPERSPIPVGHSTGKR